MFPNSNNLTTLQKYVPAGGTPDAGICVRRDHRIECPGRQDYSNRPSRLHRTQLPELPHQRELGRLEHFVQGLAACPLRLLENFRRGIDTAAQISTFWTTTSDQVQPVHPGRVPQLQRQREQRVPLWLQPLRPADSGGKSDLPRAECLPQPRHRRPGRREDRSGSATLRSSRIQNTYQAVDNISWVKGKHTFKFGGEYREVHQPAELHATRAWRLRVGQRHDLQDRIPVRTGRLPERRNARTWMKAASPSVRPATSSTTATSRRSIPSATTSGR